jgi:Transposase DDE domain
MAHSTKESLVCQLHCEQKTLESSPALPFRELLGREKVLRALERAGVTYRERVFTPMVTIYAALSQITSSSSSSCRDAVRRVIADLAARGQKACSTDTSSYCTARARLPEKVFAELAQEAGQELHRQAPLEWLWKDRHVALVDGSTAAMDDTEANQAEYPQPTNQKKGLGFPILRFVVLLSLATGSVLECALGPCHGKKTGEQSLFRQMRESLKSGDILLGDRLYDCFRDIVTLKSRGIDVVFGKKQSRQCDFRRGRRLGPRDHVVVWKKPGYDVTRYDSRAQWEALPREIEMREVSVTVRRPGHRTRTITVVTTLLDAEQYSASDLTDLFAQRWHCELDLRSIKRVLGMHHLRRRSPQAVRKELWLHLLAYNLVRVRMAQAASLHAETPRDLSFTAATKLIHNFAPHLSLSKGTEHRRLDTELLAAIAESRLDHRPGRQEPRAVKKRVQKYSYLTKPRSQTQTTKRLTP